MTHSPLPWKGILLSDGWIRDNNDATVALVPDPEDREFIVRACNSHDALVEAVEASRKLIEQIVCPGEGEIPIAPTLNLIDKALKKAGK